MVLAAGRRAIEAPLLYPGDERQRAGSAPTGGSVLHPLPRVQRQPDRARRILPWSAAVLIMLSATWYFVNWSDGTQYQGPGFVYLNLALSAGAVLAMVTIAICWKSWRSPALPMLFLWWEFVWVFGCAFPWFGESF